MLTLAVLAMALQTPQDRLQPIRDSIQRHLVSQNAAAMTVAVAKDGKILWEEGFGWANREKMIKATPHTMFSLASISKPITATGIMLLVQQGKIELDRPANDYLGVGRLAGLAGDARGATVSRVLTHTAGLPLHYRFFYQGDAYQPPTMDETIGRYGILVSAPGETMRYSNLGYGILDYIIARVSGQSYADFMRSQVFLPLGLTRTSIDVAPGLEDHAAERYDQRGRPIPFYTFDHNGGSAVYSSAHDLVRFGMFHLKSKLPEQRKILSDSLIDLMRSRALPNAFGDTAVSYGLGWVVQRDNGYPLVAHSGGMPGVATALNIYPTENLVVVALTNGGGNPFAIAEDIAAMILPRYGDSLRAQRARRREPPAPAKFTPAAELVGEWAGTLRTWEKTVPFALTVEADGDVKAQIGEPVKFGFEARAGKQLRALVNDVGWQKNVLTGRFAGTIPAADVSGVPHTIALELRLVGGKLRGQASAESGMNPLYFSVASYAELTRR